MKRLLYLTLTFLLLITTGCRRHRTIQYVRVPVDTAAANDIPGMDSDSLVLGADDDGLVAIPDIPDDRGVDMAANDYELKKMMMGKRDEEFSY